MQKHFRWILNCIDDGEVYELRKDPIGFDDCMFRMERHSVYKGIFNQFTSNIKFHNDGGGKQFIDEKYQLFDINGQVNIEVLVDADGRGINFETLFTGKLNLASYQDDGLYTIVNIEQSDLAAKLNTRADIPVPINVPVIDVPGQPSFKPVVMDEYRAEDHSNLTSGTFIFNNPAITKGKIFKVVTVDENYANIADSVTFSADGQSGPGAISGITSLQIINITDGAITVEFSDIFDSIYLFQIGPQLSLGQQVIRPVASINIPLNGIPLIYQSEFKMKGNIASDPALVITDAAILPGHSYTVYMADINANEVQDTVVYTGTTVAGTGARSGSSYIQVIAIASGSITVKYENAYGDIQVWQDSDTFVTQVTPPSFNARQDITVDDVDILGGLEYGGWMGFDTDTVFDNLNEFVFGQFNDIAQPGHVLTNSTTLPPVFNGFNEPYIDYPVEVKYKIQLTGSVKSTLSALSIHRILKGNISLVKGIELDGTHQQTILQGFGEREEIGNSETVEVNIAQEGSFTLKKDEKIWLGSFYSVKFLEGATNGSILIEWDFSHSLIQFEIVQYARPTLSQGILIHEAFNQVTDTIADSDGNFYSEFYGRADSQKRTYEADGEGSKRAITNGLCIRGHLDKYISTSLNDLFTNMAAIDNIGMEIDRHNRLRVEKLGHFFDRNTKIATLPKVYSFTTLNENSLYYNQAEIGYDKWATEIYFKNGLDEIHGKRYYGTRVATAKGSILPKYGSEIKSMVGVSNKLDRVCKLVAGNYAIELTRRKNQEWSEDDFEYDNDNFIICLAKKARVQLSFGEPDIIAVYTADLTTVLRPGSTFTVSGATANNGTYTVESLAFNGDYTTIIVTGTVSSTLRNYAFIELPDYVVETAGTLLTGENGNFINNIFRPDLAGGWLNMSITPARMLQNNMNYLTAGLQKIKGNVQFLGGEGNYLATTKYRNTGLEHQEDYNNYMLGENSNINYADGNVRNITPLWLPEVYRFEYPITYQQFKAIRANPNGYIEFYKFPGKLKKGFILSMEYNLKTGMTRFELLKVYDPVLLLQEAEDASIIADEEEQIIVSGNQLLDQLINLVP